MTRPRRSVAACAIWTIVALLAILHQDLWFWDDRRLVLGFLPIGLAYHTLFSLVCATVWAAAVRFAWPSHIEEWADEFDAPSGDGGAT